MPKKQSIASAGINEFDFCDIGDEMNAIERIQTEVNRPRMSEIF